MDIDFRWGGDPSIILAVEAALVSIPIQVRLRLAVYFFLNFITFHVQFVNIRLLLPLVSVEGSTGFHHYPCYIPTC